MGNRKSHGKFPTRSIRSNVSGTAQPPRPTRVRDLWVQSGGSELAFELVLPELPGVVGYTEWDGDPGPSMTWLVKINGNEPQDEHLGIEDTGDSVEAAKQAVEEIMLSMLSAHGKIALTKRLQP